MAKKLLRKRIEDWIFNNPKKFITASVLSLSLMGAGLAELTIKWIESPVKYLSYKEHPIKQIVSYPAHARYVINYIEDGTLKQVEYRQGHPNYNIFGSIPKEVLDKLVIPKKERPDLVTILTDLPKGKESFARALRIQKGFEEGDYVEIHISPEQRIEFGAK